MRLTMLLPLFLLAACATPAHFIPDEAHGFFSSEAAGHKHEIYLPEGWSAEQKWPVIVFLHGGGQRGSDGIQPTQDGIGPMVWASNRKLPFIVVFPQTASGSFWAYPEMERRALDTLDDVLKNYGGDPQRVYLTGNSMGGFGTWIIAARNPGRFAALAPICGGVKAPAIVPIPKAARDEILRAKDPYSLVAQKLGKTPAWIFHGGSDPLVSPKQSRKMVEAMKRTGAEVRYTEYAKVGHHSWDRAYAEPELFTWFLLHKL